MAQAGSVRRANPQVQVADTGQRCRKSCLRGSSRHIPDVGAADRLGRVNRYLGNGVDGELAGQSVEHLHNKRVALNTRIGHEPPVDANVERTQLPRVEIDRYRLDGLAGLPVANVHADRADEEHLDGKGHEAPVAADGRAGGFDGATIGSDRLERQLAGLAIPYIQPVRDLSAWNQLSR